MKIKGYFDDWNIFERIWILLAPCIILGLSIYWKDTLIGIVSAVSGVLCVILTAKGKLSAYVFGTINTILYALIAFETKYYGDFMLNMFYFLPFQFIGFYLWKNNMNGKEVSMQKMSMKQLISWIFICIVAIFCYGLFLQSLDGNLPFIDSISTVLSVFAMYISARRYQEQWLAWIVINIVTIGMWVTVFVQNGENVATLLMWVIYLLNAIYGYINWNRKSEEERCIM